MLAVHACIISTQGCKLKFIYFFLISYIFSSPYWSNNKKTKLFKWKITLIIRYFDFKVYWLQTVSSTFQDIDFKGSIYNCSILVDAKLLVSKICPIIAKYVAVNFVAQWVTIATIWSAKNTLNFSFKLL